MVTSKNFFKDYFSSINDSLTSVNLDHLSLCATMVRDCVSRGGKVIIAGNGGSSAIASHVSVDFTKTVQIRSINFNEADLITCFSNDYGYENWVAEALKAYADQRDLVILISSSGQSMNMVNAADQCHKMALPLITLTGFSAENPLRKMGDINLWVQSDGYNVVEITHQTWLLALVDLMIANKETE